MAQLSRAFLWLLAIGLLIRIPFMPFMGFEQDFFFMTSWASYLADNSLITIYDNPLVLEYELINYPPFYLYILTFLAHLYRLFPSSPFETTFFLLLLKTVTVFFEILIAITLYKTFLHRSDKKFSLFAAGIYFLNPAILYVSVYYGQVDAIFCLFLLLSFLFTLQNRPLWGGFFIAFSVLTKIQALPFVPIVFLLTLKTRSPKQIILAVMGFLAGSALLLAPYIFTGRLLLVWQRCIVENIEWGQYVTVGAFNLWGLHADPSTYDFRILGWLYGADGILTANPLFLLLTYKNVATLLFGIAFLGSVYTIWKNKDQESVWVALAHIALAFFILPTKVHERYLYPFFVLYAIPTCLNRKRLFFYIAYSLTYLINLMYICPLVGDVKPVEEIYTTTGVILSLCNVLLYGVFVMYEFNLLRWEKVRWKIILGYSVAGILITLLTFYNQENKSQKNILYLSELTPITVVQDWPLISPDIINEAGYAQVKKDLSSDDQPLRIGPYRYRYGLGAHATSRIDYEIPGEYTLFEIYVGVDREVLDASMNNPNVGTVIFKVLMRGKVLYESPLMIASSYPHYVMIPLEPTEHSKRLTLIVEDGNNGNHSDHADWALARLRR